jgi:hypothetical protein
MLSNHCSRLSEVDHALAPGPDGGNVELVAGSHEAGTAQHMPGYDHKADGGQCPPLQEGPAGRAGKGRFGRDCIVWLHMLN